LGPLYVFFAAFALIALAFVYFIVLETRGKVIIFHTVDEKYLHWRAFWTLDMDSMFGDAVAHEKKQRMKKIEAQLTGQYIRTADKDKIIDEEYIE
jgi:hypothetical protein